MFSEIGLIKDDIDRMTAAVQECNTCNPVFSLKENQMLNATRDIGRANEILGNLEGGRIGSDLSNILEKLAEWVKTLDLGTYAQEGLHALLHFAVDVLIPKLKEYTPTYGDLVIDAIIIPLLKKIDEQWHPSA